MQAKIAPQLIPQSEVLIEKIILPNQTYVKFAMRGAFTLGDFIEV